MSTPFGPDATTAVYPGDNAQAGPIAATDATYERVDIFVSDAPVWASFLAKRFGVTGGTWGADEYLPCTKGNTFFFSFDRICSGIRFKSASTTQAVVSGVLITGDEIPRGG